jgi:hypothetical protein
MSIFVSEDPKKGTVTIRHTWRAEIFSEFGEDAEIRVHRAQATYDSDTTDLVRTDKDRVVIRRLEQLPDAQRQTILNFFTLCDVFEMEDTTKEEAEKKNG